MRPIPSASLQERIIATRISRHLMSQHRTMVERLCPSCESRDTATLLVRNTYSVAQCQPCQFTFCYGYSSVDYENDSHNGWIRLEDKNKFVKEFRRFVAIARRYVSEPGKWLDVGCNLGFAVLAAESLGFQAIGVEPGKEVATRAQENGVNVRQGILHELRSETFQVISYFDVLEHIENPLAELRLASSMLAKGGIIVVKVPNCYRDILSIKAREDVELWAPDHKNFFALPTLISLLTRADLQVKRIVLGTHFYSTILRISPWPQNRTMTRIFKWPLFPIVKAVQRFESCYATKCDYFLCVAEPITGKSLAAIPNVKT